MFSLILISTVFWSIELINEILESPTSKSFNRGTISLKNLLFSECNRTLHFFSDINWLSDLILLPIILHPWFVSFFISTSTIIKFLSNKWASYLLIVSEYITLSASPPKSFK